MDGMSRKREMKGGSLCIYFGVIHGWWRTYSLVVVCYEKLKSATIALIFPCHQHNAREKWAKYSQPHGKHIVSEIVILFIKLCHKVAKILG